MNVETPKHVNQEAVYLALQMCCGGDTRYNLRRPFKSGRDVYATNGIIIARVPEWAAPWVTGREQTPGCQELPWEPEKYANTPTPWTKFPKPIVPECSRCEELAKGEKESLSEDASVWELLDFADPPQICSKCGMYTASEVGADYQLGSAWFNARQCRKLATIGAQMYAPLHPGKGNLEAWRWEIPDLYMIGLLMPVKRGEA